MSFATDEKNIFVQATTADGRLAAAESEKNRWLCRMAHLMSLLIHHSQINLIFGMHMKCSEEKCF